MEWFVAAALIVSWVVLTFVTLQRIDRLEDKVRDLRSVVDKLRYDADRHNM